MRKIIWILFSITVFIVFLALSLKFKEQTSDRLLLLYPNDTDLILIEGWKNVAAEEGLHLDILSNNEFIYSKSLRLANQYKGIILPDMIQTRMPPILSDRIKSYVRDGGFVFLIFDAGTENSEGAPLNQGSMFADVLDLNYTVTNNGITTGSGPIGNDRDSLDTLAIPPGKCIVGHKKNDGITQTTDTFCAISSYGYGPLTYTYYLTKPIDNGKDLLLTTSNHQFIAGVKTLDKGKILFVNLPLTNLWRTTDAMLLHAFLHYFAVDMLHLPTLSTVPNGVGGLVMNLHVESIDALDAMSILEKQGLFQQGPYSLDFTAGPDLEKLKDNQGLNVLHNPVTQSWIHRLAKMGNAIGSDGGWAHNYYGVYASENNQSEFQKYITMNNDAMEKVLGKKVVEYVPSMGNQPNWATRYLEEEGFVAYYTTSNIGTAPTQNFRDGVFDSPKIWSFPLLPLGLYASIRDFGFAKLPVEVVSKWLTDSTDFVAAKHVSRLIYYHPTDILYFKQYLHSLQAWLKKANELSHLGVFHWYSMTDIAEFLNARRGVTWSVKNKDAMQKFSATHPKSLEHQAWLIDKSTCMKPMIIAGVGNVKEDAKVWIVIAGVTKRLEFQCKIPDIIQK